MNFADKILLSKTQLSHSAAVGHMARWVEKCIHIFAVLMILVSPECFVSASCSEVLVSHNVIKVRGLW